MTSDRAATRAAAVHSAFKTCSKPPTKTVSLCFLLSFLSASGPEYVIESKITLSQAAAENTEKIVNQKKKQENTGAGGFALPSQNLPTGGTVQGGTEYKRTSANGGEGVDLMFEGTFKP